MACYDEDTLTASETGELSVHMKSGGGLNSSGDGVFVDFNTTAPHNGLYLQDGKLATKYPATIGPIAAAVSTGGGGYAPLPVGIAGRVRTVSTGDLWFVNNTPYNMLFQVYATYDYEVEVTNNAEWRCMTRILVNGVETVFTPMKLRNQGTGGSISHLQTYNETAYFLIAPGGNPFFSASMEHWSEFGTSNLLASACALQIFGISLPPM